MRELFAMWRNTRMVVLAAITAALYAAILIPFKIIPIIPGVAELRPANAIPIVCSFLFGPAAAWGAAIGNSIGDFFGGFGPGDIFGFLGNLLYGLVPYKIWSGLGGGDPVPRCVGGWLAFALAVGMASLLCAVTVGWGLNLLGFHPFSVLAPVVFVNNFVMAMTLAPLLLSVLYPRVARGRLLYRDLLPDEHPTAAPLRWLGLGLVIVGGVGSFLVGSLISLGWWAPPWLPGAGESGGTRALAVGLGIPPFLFVVLAGLALL
jgi:energy-coupling factor transport system substrate-specific component